MPQKPNRKKSKTSAHNGPQLDQKTTDQLPEKTQKDIEKLFGSDLGKRIQNEICVSSQFSSGPIPAPQILDGYEKICPGSADRIIKMAEEESAHRRKMEEKALNAEIEFNQRSLKIDGRETMLGQIFGLIIGSLTILCGSYVAVSGAYWPGTIIGSTGVVGLVTTFIVGRKGTQNNITNTQGNTDNK